MPPSASLRMLVFGAGAIGSYIGGSLAARSQRVVFIERPAVAEHIRRNGLRLQPAGQAAPICLPPTAFEIVTSPQEALALAPFDLALSALKSYDTPAILPSLQILGDTFDALLCLSNGVDNEPLLAEAVGAGKIIAATVTSAIGRRAAGEVVVERLRGVGLAAGHPLSKRLAAVMNDAGLNAHLYARPSDMKWSKLLTNLLANATAAILDLTPAEIFAHPGLFRLEMAQLREALAVMRAQGIGVVDLPRTPVRLLAWATRLPSALARPLLGRAVGHGRGSKMPSFHIDLHSGRGQSEVAYLNGAVARYGERYRIPTPINRWLTDTLLSLTEGKLPLDTFAQKPEKVLKTCCEACGVGI